MGPELPDLIVLEVGVAEGPQGRPLGADVVRPHSLWWARQASGICGGEGTARAQARPSPVVGPGPMRHPAGWPGVDWMTPLRSCEMDERARITTPGELEASVLALS